jgi:hypothetical protein
MPIEYLKQIAISVSTGLRLEGDALRWKPSPAASREAERVRG